MFHVSTQNKVAVPRRKDLSAIFVIAEVAQAASSKRILDAGKRASFRLLVPISLRLLDGGSHVLVVLVDELSLQNTGRGDPNERSILCLAHEGDLLLVVEVIDLQHRLNSVVRVGLHFKDESGKVNDEQYPCYDTHDSASDGVESVAFHLEVERNPVPKEVEALEKVLNVYSFHYIASK